MSQSKEVVSQTDVRESKPIAAQTNFSLFALRECDSQTLVKQYAERSIQTLILGLLITDSEAQTSKFAIHDIGIQIDVVRLDEALQTEIDMEDEAVQSQGLPEWWSARQTQTDYFDTWETASQVSFPISDASSQTAQYLSIYGQDAEVQVETLRMRVKKNIYTVVFSIWDHYLNHSEKCSFKYYKVLRVWSVCMYDMVW